MHILSPSKGNQFIFGTNKLNYHPNCWTILLLVMQPSFNYKKLENFFILIENLGSYDSLLLHNHYHHHHTYKKNKNNHIQHHGRQENHPCYFCLLSTMGKVSQLLEGLEGSFWG